VVRNTPTLLNAGYQCAQYVDQRVAFLEFQFEEVMANPREMALTPDSAARRLGADAPLAARFTAAFGRPPGQALTGQTLSLAVAAYVRSLQALNSRFDRAIRGDSSAITRPSDGASICSWERPRAERVTSLPSSGTRCRPPSWNRSLR
jgi:cytochrome c peroxidase